MSKIKLTGSNSGYVEIDSAADAGNLTLTLPTSGVRLLSNTDNVFSGITTTGELDINGKIDVSTDAVITRNLSVGGITTHTGTTTLSDDVTFTGGSYNVLWDKSDNQLEFGDNAKLSFGADADLQIYHSGSGSAILNGASSGQLTIASDNALNLTSRTGTEYYFRAYPNNRAELYYDFSTHNTPKLQTSATGVTVDGIVAATSFSGSGEGLTRTTQLSHRNLIQNGNFVVFQRFLPGSFVTCNAGSNFYSMDRWYARGEGSKGVFNFIQEDITSQGQGAHAAARVTVTTSSTPSTNDVYKIAQRIEGKNVQHLSWGTSGAKTITLSFLVKSTVTGTHGGSIMNSAQNRAYPFTYAISSANTWEQKSITIPGDTGGTWLTNTGIGLELNFDMGTAESNYRRPAGSWYAGRAEGADGAVQLITTNSANWYVTKVQIEEGSHSTPFEHISLQDNFSQCKRYYETMGRGASQYMGNGWFFNSSSFYCVLRFEVEKRVAPTIDQNTGSNYFIVWHTGGSNSFNSFNGVSWPNTRAAAFYTSSGVSGTAGDCGGLGCSNAEAFFAASADL